MAEKVLTYQELSELLRECAGVTVDSATMESGTVDFSEIGVDSLGVLGAVAELERRFDAKFGTDAEATKSPRELVELVNARLRNGS